MSWRLLFSNPTAPDVNALWEALRHLQSITETMARKEEAIRADPQGLALQAATLRYAGWAYGAQARLGDVFLDVLQSYQLAPAERKTIESAAKLFNKRHESKRFIPSKAAEAYFSRLSDFRKYANVLEHTLRSGKLHTGGTAAGEFVLINTGGFSAAAMKSAAKRTVEAAEMLRLKGLDFLLYGDIQITNSLRGSTNLAFYRISDDSLFVRANIRKLQQDEGRDHIIHELGHRLHMKFLRQKLGVRESDRRLESFYERLMRIDNERVWDSLPDLGTEFVYRSKKYVVTRKGLSRGQPVLTLQGPKGIASMSGRAWLEISGGSAFVSFYAQQNANENFAETLVAYCKNTLAPEVRRSFEEIMQ